MSNPNGKRVYIQSKALGTYVRMNGTDVHRFNPDGSGHVNCSQTNGRWEMFEIVPVAGHDGVFNIKSMSFPDVYLRMDAQGLPHEKMPDGGGIVNCQFGTGDYPGFEDFRIQANADFMTIESASRSGFYLRMFGTGGGDHGFGVVNCQYGVGPNEQLNFLTINE